MPKYELEELQEKILEIQLEGFDKDNEEHMEVLEEFYEYIIPMMSLATENELSAHFLNHMSMALTMNNHTSLGGLPLILEDKLAFLVFSQRENELKLLITNGEMSAENLETLNNLIPDQLIEMAMGQEQFQDAMTQIEAIYTTESFNPINMLKMMMAKERFSNNINYQFDGKIISLSDIENEEFEELTTNTLIKIRENFIEEGIVNEYGDIGDRFIDREERQIYLN